MFDIEYVGNIVSQFLAQEKQYQEFKGKRDFLFRQIANHTGFFGRNLDSVSQEESEIIEDFIKIFLRTNNQYDSRFVHPYETSFRQSATHLGGVRDGD